MICLSILCTTALLCGYVGYRFGKKVAKWENNHKRTNKKQ